MGLQFLKKGKANKVDLSVKYLLHKLLSDYDPARPLSRIHASELTKDDGFCPRMYALHDVTKTKAKDRWLTTSERMTFQIGRDQERNIVNWLGEENRAVCDWKCVQCGTKHEFQFKPIKCTTCGCRVTEPVEIRFQSAINGASCGVDMLIKLNAPKLVPVELKTMDKDLFKALTAPLPEHKWRTNLYLRLIAESASPHAHKVQTNEARILYVSKGGYGCADPTLSDYGVYDKFSPFKEFIIQRDDSVTDGIVNRSKAVVDFRAGKVGMPKGICASATHKRAANCPMKGKCFSGDFPPEYDWSKNEQS